MCKGKEHRVSRDVVSPPASLGRAEGEVEGMSIQTKRAWGKAKNILKKKNMFKQRITGNILCNSGKPAQRQC